MNNFVKKFANGVAGTFGLELRKKRSADDAGPPETTDPAFKKSYKANQEFTMVPWTGCYTAFSAARYVGQNKLPGAIVECGVFRGGCSMIMADGLLAAGENSKEIYMYDTYEGMTEPTEVDQKQSRGKMIKAADKYSEMLKEDHSEWSYCPIEQVVENLKRSDYPHANFKTIKGKVEETIPNVVPEKISLLRLDTDWYESTKHEMEHLYSRLVVGGVLIIDDYGSWEGSKVAVDEYFSKEKYHPFFYKDTSNGAVACIKL